MIHLDTHVVAWLYQGRLDRLPTAARHALQVHAPVISPMVYLELQYLFEIGRTTRPPQDVTTDLTARIGLRFSDASFAAVVRTSQDLDWTRDPFDRLICANAMVDGCRLLTADRTLLEHLPGAAWD